MAIFIDTANPTHAERAKKFGWVRGITTNPLLLAQEKGDPASILKELSDIGLGHVFYQLMAPDAESMKAEAVQNPRVKALQYTVMKLCFKPHTGGHTCAV